MEGIFKGRVAIITGSGNGLGRAHAIALAARGAQVIVNDIGTSAHGVGTSHDAADAVVKRITDAGGAAVASYDSVAEEEGAQRIIDLALKRFGRLDILVNNAGIIKNGAVDKMATGDWDAVVKTHLYGTFYCTRAAVPIMKRQAYGRIINTSSAVGFGLINHAAYSASKEGITGFSRTMARELAKSGITCNVIRPVAAWRGTDRVLTAVPFKGQVLNQLAAFWFERTADIFPNHILAVPDPNVSLVRECETLPVEVIVRGYITGVTSTSLWTLYEQGDRQPYGIPLPDGLQKNDPLPAPIITPTTKATGGAHDQRLTRDEIIDQGLIDEALWDQVEAAALAIFARGQDVAWQAGLILVDTKYEFGLIDGQLAIIDEIHTPDSSRYWIANTYERGDETSLRREPENFDKETLRMWFVEQGYRGEGTPPQMPDEFVAAMAERYITTYELLTGQIFVPGDLPAGKRIARNVITYLSTR